MNHDQIVNEVMLGKGYYIFKNAVTDDKLLQKAARIIRNSTSKYDDNTLERRAWGLNQESKIFSKFIQHPLIVPIITDILGNKHKVSSFGASLIMPGSIEQEPHTDYPYWGLFDLKSLPKNINSSFVLGCQIIAPVTSFTKENGATAIVPNTQTLCRYPDPSEFEDKKIYLEMESGDICLYNSLLWHRASANNSTSARIALLGQYTASFIRDF
tara:strand:+ start:13 stop:651 length:639 start_codon:yes stop_codon:yes gene_type:complete